MDQIERKHSGIGIASFIISIVVGILMFVVIAAGAIYAASTPGGLSKSLSMLVGLAMIGLFLLCLVGLGLGVGALFQKDRKRIFAVLGTVFCLAILAGVVLLYMVGISMG